MSFIDTSDMASADQPTDRPRRPTFDATRATDGSTGSHRADTSYPPSLHRNHGHNQVAIGHHDTHPCLTEERLEQHHHAIEGTWGDHQVAETIRQEHSVVVMQAMQSLDAGPPLPQHMLAQVYASYQGMTPMQQHLAEAIHGPTHIGMRHPTVDVDTMEAAAGTSLESQAGSRDKGQQAHHDDLAEWFQNRE